MCTEAADTPYEVRRTQSRHLRSTSGAAAAEFFASQSWAQLGVAQPFILALSSIGISRPSHVQARPAHCPPCNLPLEPRKFS